VEGGGGPSCERRVNPVGWRSPSGKLSWGGEVCVGRPEVEDRWRGEPRVKILSAGEVIPPTPPPHPPPPQR